MTSDVDGAHARRHRLADVFTALFPCGSITGAPKVQAMRLIRDLEPQPRGVYCGAVGVVRPGGACDVQRGDPHRDPARHGGALRHRQRHHGRCAGRGRMGRVAPQARLPRTRKPAVRTARDAGLEDGALRDAPAHLARMASAAAHFALSRGTRRDVAGALAAAGRRAPPQARWRVRLRLDAGGQVAGRGLRAGPHAERRSGCSWPRARSKRQTVSSCASRPRGARTTTRSPPATPGVFDTLLWNRHGELTECTRGNVALLLDGRWVTPALRCGLLGGIGACPLAARRAA